MKRKRRVCRLYIPFTVFTRVVLRQAERERLYVLARRACKCSSAVISVPGLTPFRSILARSSEGEYASDRPHTCR